MWVGMEAIAVWANGASRTSTPEHKEWRLVVLRRDRFRCQLRLSGCAGLAAEADHIVPVSRGGAPYDPDNGQAVCASCHERKTREEGKALRAAQSRYREPYRHPAFTDDVVAELAAVRDTGVAQGWGTPSPSLPGGVRTS